MLARVGREFAQQLAGRHDARDHCGGAAQDVWPVCGDDAVADFAADWALWFLGGAGWFEDIEPLGGQILDAGNELEAQESSDGEDMVGEAADVGILLFDIATGLVHQQTIKDVVGFADRRWNGLGGEGPELIRDVGIGFQPRLIAIFGIDQIHCLTLAGGRENCPSLERVRPSLYL
jgi:hypothetical protein